MADNEGMTRIFAKSIDGLSAPLTLSVCVNQGNVCVEIPTGGSASDQVSAKTLREVLPPVDGVSMAAKTGFYTVRTQFQEVIELVNFLRRIGFRCSEQESLSGRYQRVIFWK